MLTLKAILRKLLVLSLFHPLALGLLRLLQCEDLLDGCKFVRRGNVFVLVEVLLRSVILRAVPSQRYTTYDLSKQKHILAAHQEEPAVDVRI